VKMSPGGRANPIMVPDAEFGPLSEDVTTFRPHDRIFAPEHDARIAAPADDDWVSPPATTTRRRTPPPRVRGETERTEDVLAWMNAQPGVYAMKKHTNAQGEGGHPDIFACRRGRMVLVEMKKPGEEPTLRQRQRLTGWQKAGAAVCWAFDVEHVQQLFERIDAEPDWINPLTGPGVP
jgi:hypothetical protein